jgi:hypothetical protein
VIQAAFLSTFYSNGAYGITIPFLSEVKLGAGWLQFLFQSRWANEQA